MAWNRYIQIAGRGEVLGQEISREWRRPFPLPSRAKMANPSDTNHYNMKGDEGLHREGYAGTHWRRSYQQWEHPQGPTGTWAQAEGRNWVMNGRGTRRHKKARGAGRIDERQRLAGVKCGKSPGGRCTTPG